MFEGKIYKTKSGDCQIIGYKNSKHVVVKFLDKHGYITKATLHDIKRGSVGNPYYPSVKGFGYMGEGSHKSRDEDGKKSKVYQTWASMMERGYCQDFKNKHPSYKGCTVHKDWHNFQNFAEWYTNQKFYSFGYEIDKDLLIKGNLIYSKDTCTLIPREINSLFGRKVSSKGLYPQGVNFHKASKCFRVIISCRGDVRYLGLFKTQEEASAAYVKAKEAYVKEVALEWKGKIEPRAFDALMNWTVY